MTTPPPPFPRPAPSAPPATPAWTWIAAIVGFVVQTAVTVWVSVDLAVSAVDYHDRSQSHGGFSGDGFFEGIGSFLILLLAVVTFVFALVLALVLFLSSRRGGTRLAGLIVGIVLQVPLVFLAVAAIDNGVGVQEVATLVGAGLVVLAIACPPTWHWCSRPRTAAL